VLRTVAILYVIIYKAFSSLKAFRLSLC